MNGVAPFSSLEELRAEKQVVIKRIGTRAERLRSSVVDSFMPSNTFFGQSPNKFFKIIGYGIAAYKAYVNVRNMVSFFKRRAR